MMSLFSARPWSLTAVVGLLLWFAAAAPAHSANVLENLKASPGVSAPDILPAARSPRFYRQTVIVTCNTNNPILGSNGCIMAFDRVPAHRLLQIDTAQCTSTGTSGVIIFRTQIKLDNAHLVGFLPPPVAPSNLSETRGPFFMRANEIPKLATNGGAPTDTAICLIHGTMWTTN